MLNQLKTNNNVQCEGSVDADLVSACGSSSRVVSRSWAMPGAVISRLSFASSAQERRAPTREQILPIQVRQPKGLFSLETGWSGAENEIAAEKRW